MPRNMKPALFIVATIGVLGLSVVEARRPIPLSPLGVERQRATMWVAQHKTSLPRTFEGLSRHSLVYRKAAYRQLSMGEQKQAWRAHFESFLKPESQVTSQQLASIRSLDAPLSSAKREHIQRMIDVLDRAFDSSLSLRERQANVAPLCEQKLALFSEHDARLIFNTLGPVDNGYTELIRETGTCQRV